MNHSEILSGLIADLSDIHRFLLKYQGRRSEKQLERQLGPYELWALAVEDESFAWTRKLSATIILLEDLGEKDEALNAETKNCIRTELNGFFIGQNEKHQEFYQKFTSVLEMFPEVHIIRGRIVQKLNLL